MKKMMIAALALVATAATAQVKGRFEVHDMGSFRLHVYYTNDVMNDASFIVEGNDSVVTMEQPLFKDNAAEFDAYVEKMGKPVAARIPTTTSAAPPTIRCSWPRAWARLQRALYTGA